MNGIWDYINPSDDYLSAIIGMIMSIIALALPLSQNTISDRLATYHNKHILEMFKAERTYKAMLFSILLLIVALVLSILFEERSDCRKLVGLLCLFVGIASVIIFWMYFRRTNQYAVNTDNVVFDYCKKKMAALPDTRENHKERWELLEIAACVIEHKEISGDYADIEEIVNFIEDSFISILKDKSYVKDDRNVIVRNYSMKFFSLFINLWKNCYRKSPSTAVMLTSAYDRVVKHAILYEKEDNFGINPCVPLFYLYQQIAASLEPEDIKTPRTANYCWKWYFDVVLSDDFPVESITMANAYLLTVMKNIIDYDILFVFKAYIGHIIDSLIFSRFENYVITEDLNVNLKISNLLQQSDRIVLSNEYPNVSEELEGIGLDEISKEELSKRIKRHFVYNNIQLVTLLMGAYGMFRDKYDFVKALIYYNQPLDSEALFGNKDIVPEKFEELVVMYMKADDAVIPYLTIWPDHHDITYCYKQFLCFLTIVQAKHADSQIDVNIGNFYANSQQLQHLKNVIEQFKEAVMNYSGEKLDKIDIHDSTIIKNYILAALDDIIKNIEKTDANLQEGQSLDENKVEVFMNSVIDQTRNNSIWVRAFEENDLESGTKYECNIGLRTYIRKTFLAEKDNGIYVDFPHGFSSVLIRQLDLYVERKLLAQSKLHQFSGFRISKDDYKRKVLDFDKDYSAVFINVYNYHEFLFDAPGFQWIWEDGKVGITANGCNVYCFGDPDSSIKRMVAFNKHCFSKIDVTISKENFKVIDLNTSKTDREKLYNTPELSNLATDDERDGELKKCVLVEITGKARFFMKDDAEIAYVNDGRYS